MPVVIEWLSGMHVWVPEGPIAVAQRFGKKVKKPIVSESIMHEGLLVRNQEVL
ncbi:MAG TPA: hypothetical protein ACFYD2_11230 [Candidatus Avalokitesvara rifleensis]|uniref:hypothetical protein n=1 Tax=Candidatus Avalokitesvara rifleensis TaxID=3367620 RepID=UPI0040293FAE